MAKTYAAFYLPQEEPVVPVANEKETQSLASTITGAWNKAYNYVTNLDENDIRNMARNMNIQGKAYFTQKYAAGALSKIINGEPVTNKTMLDSLFNTYAPALNAGLAQTGFNSLVEMRNAVQTGNNINVPNFIQGFANGLTVIQDLCKEKPSKYGEEVPIDVITSLVYEYKREIAQKTIDKKINLSQYIGPLDPATITIKANVKNENAELWNINDFNHKIVNHFMDQSPITFRVGKSIYENCIIDWYKPTITNIYSISFEMKINYDFYMNTNTQEKKESGGLLLMNPNPTNQKLINKYSDEKYIGVMGGKN